MGVTTVTGKWKKRSVIPRRAEASRGGSPPGWYSRGYLPHFDGGQIAQAVTFRLFDSLPRSILEQWRQELSQRPEKDAETEERKRIEAHLDRGEGSAWMKDARIAAVVPPSVGSDAQSRSRNGDPQWGLGIRTDSAFVEVVHRDRM